MARKSIVFGYARVSTMKQKLSRQIENIKREYPNATIITEEYTGTTTNRPNFNKMLNNLVAGDTVVFDEVSRMSRNAEEGFALYQELFNKGVDLVFIKEKHLNTETFRTALSNKVALTGTDVDVILQGVNEYLMILAKRQIEIAFEQAQAEVDYLHQRTSEGVRQAMAQGKQVGRATGSKVETKKAKECKQRILELSKDFNGNNSDADVMKILGIARNSYYKYKAELKQM